MALTSGSYEAPPTPFPTSGRTQNSHPAANPITLVTTVPTPASTKIVVLQPKVDAQRLKKTYPFRRIKPLRRSITENIPDLLGVPIRRGQQIDLLTGSNS